MAAPGVTPFEPFDEGGVQYFHVQGREEAGGFAGAAARWAHRTNEDSLLSAASAVIEQYGPDLIHVHGSEGPFGRLAETAAVPLLISLQGILLVYSRAYFSGIPAPDVVRDAASLEFLKGGGFLHAYWDMRIAARRELGILRACRYFTGRTAWDRGIVSVVNPQAQYYHVDEVLRPEFFLDEWRPIIDGPFVIYTTAGPAPYKGLVNLLEAVALLRDSVRSDIRLRIAGQIEGASMWPIAQRALDRFRLRGVVDFLGPLRPAGIISELKAASVYVQPSLAENSPNSLAEAMLLGVPCVASSAGGVPSLLRDGLEGLLCPSNDVYGLAGAIGAIDADPARAAGLGMNARTRARRRHDPHTIAQDTRAVYGDVIARHQARR